MKNISNLKLPVVALAVFFGLIFFGLDCSAYTADFGSIHHPFKGVGWNWPGMEWSGAPSAAQYAALDASTPQFMRYVWYMESYQSGTNVATNSYDSPASQANIAFLQHAKQKNITVMLTNWNSGGVFDERSAWPDHAYWMPEIGHNDPANFQDRFCRLFGAPDPGTCSDADKIDKTIGNKTDGPESDHPYDDAVFAQTIADYVDYAVNQKNGRVDYLSLWNEPGGDWSYHPRDPNKKYPASFTGLYRNTSQKLAAKGLDQKVKLVGLDDSYDELPGKSIKPYIDYALANWNSWTNAYSLHNYSGITGANSNLKYLFDRAQGKPVIIGETGGNCASTADRWTNSLTATRLMISDIRTGAYAAARWWFRGSDPTVYDMGCFIAMDGDKIIPETYNSLKILANTLPQTDQDISVVNTDLPEFGSDFDAVAINAAPSGESVKPVVWAANNGVSDRTLPITFRGVTDPETFQTKILQGVYPYNIQEGPALAFSPQNPSINFNIPANSIFVAVASKTCVPKDCAALGYACGNLDDGCGAALSCGACASGQMCSGNKCITGSCIPKTCATLGNHTCGSWPDNCGGTINCGGCSSDKTCSNGTCATNAANLPAVSITANGSQGSATVGAGVPVTLSWNSTSADTCRASGDWSGNLAASGSQTVAASQSKTYAITCSNSSGPSSASVTVNIGSQTNANANTNTNTETQKPVTQMTRAEVLAAIARIQTLIADLQKQFEALTGNTTTFSCASITKNLFYGMKNDSQVKCLQEVLEAQGLFGGTVTGNFGAITKAAVIQFQEKYASEILAPYHLTRGSGDVGNSTRAKINSLITK